MRAEYSTEAVNGCALFAVAPDQPAGFRLKPSNPVQEHLKGFNGLVGIHRGYVYAVSQAQRGGPTPFSTPACSDAEDHHVFKRLG